MKIGHFEASPRLVVCNTSSILYFGCCVGVNDQVTRYISKNPSSITLSKFGCRFESRGRESGTEFIKVQKGKEINHDGC